LFHVEQKYKNIQTWRCVSSA